MQVQTVQNYIDRLYNHRADFYRTRWRKRRLFSELPFISRADFIQTPLSARRYEQKDSLVKLVRTNKGWFLSEWGFEDIGREAFGIESRRPMVYISDSHEAIEKSMWCYEHNMVPLIGEMDPDIAMYAASKYQIDSLITDENSLPKLLPYLRNRTEPLVGLTILGLSFNVETLAPFSEYSQRSRLVLCRAETGAFAEATLSPDPVFTLLPQCIGERAGDSFVLTKLADIVTPIVKYKFEPGALSHIPQC